MLGNGAHWDLAHVVQQLRRNAGLTQKEMAERANISLAGLRDLEQQRVTRPRVSTLRRIAAALELSPSEAKELVRLGSQGPVLAHDLRLQVLGPLSITVDGTPVNLGSERQRTMLAILALSPGVPATIDTLVDAAWGGQPPPTAVDLVRSQMSRLRRRIQPKGRTAPVLVAINGGYALRVDDNQLDLLACRGLVADARRDRKAGRLDSAVSAYKQAMDLWRGEPLWDLPGLHEQPALANLRRELETALLEYADTASALGRHEEVLTPLYRFTEANPLHEPGHARLMTALAGAGQRAVALEVFENLRRALSAELGVDPGVLVRETHQAILLGEPTPAQLTVVPPQSTTTVAKQPVPTQLPADVYGFTGRARELAHLDAVLDDGRRQPTMVVAALLGRPGVGKTSLAVHWAHRIARHFSDGQLYAELGCADPADVLRNFLLSLGVPPNQVPESLANRAALYRSLLTGREMLVLLDNAKNADQVRSLLPGSPGCVVVVTSRDPLAGLVTAEGARPLTVEALTEADALTLLHRRLGPARMMAEPEVAREIVARCEGLPAALAAVATRAITDTQLPLASLAEELRGTAATGTWPGRPWRGRNVS
ncbi:BTAD domain-containing putative transcriptional regulator [Saccharomonospora sp. NB11]|uniref:BTAD domain-containing putative transcriptional regulator n=1 Tax=Saccharomonospora sp. NB11 TaxID=1642298 RepID=UPI00210647B5|nr:BTAD domain-containing putative transcriptional regulator [Saccharomonospora sp. NB11]